MSRAIAVGLVSMLCLTGCFGGRPSGVAVHPEDCYCELSEPQVTNFNGELKFKVHYLFPDGPPKHEAWYLCTFELMSANNSSITVRKQGKELLDEGEFEGSTSTSFMRTMHGTFAVQVKQAAAKGGPYRDVSARLVYDY